MSRGDFEIIDNGGYNVVPTRVYQVASGAAASIKAGEPVVLTTIGTSQYAVLASDAQPVIGTDYFAGFAAKDSTDTASAAGEVEVYRPLPGVVFRGKAKSAAAADTLSEIQALANKRVPWDLTSAAFTVDTAAADGSTNGLILTGTGDASLSKVDFSVSVRATNLGF